MKPSLFSSYAAATQEKQTIVSNLKWGQTTKPLHGSSVCMAHKIKMFSLSSSHCITELVTKMRNAHWMGKDIPKIISYQWKEYWLRTNPIKPN